MTAVSRVSKRTKKIGQMTTDMSRLINISTSLTPESKSLSSREERIAREILFPHNFYVRCAFLGWCAGLRAQCG